MRQPPSTIRPSAVSVEADPGRYIRHALQHANPRATRRRSRELLLLLTVFLAGFTLGTIALPSLLRLLEHAR